MSCGSKKKKEKRKVFFAATLISVRVVQVCIPVVSVRLVKKHKTAGLVPNGLAITMDTGQKVVQTRPVGLSLSQHVCLSVYLTVCLSVCLQYVFVSLLSRDSVYDVLRRICTHLQVGGQAVRLRRQTGSGGLVTSCS